MDVFTDVQFSWEMLTKTNETRQPDSDDPNVTDMRVASCILNIIRDKLGPSPGPEKCNYTEINELTEFDRKT